MTIRKQVLWTAAVLWASVAAGGVFLDTERNAIRVADYPPEAPCDLPQLAASDRAFGWGRIAYDPKKNVCAITGDLIIGANDDTETVLQVGSAERPNETLVMKGTIYVYPYYIRGENKGNDWSAPVRMNALVLGDKHNKSVNATLQFACTPADKHTLSCGRLPWIKPQFQSGGGLYVYNSQIAPLNPAPGYEIGDGIEGMYLMGSTVFDNARITGVIKSLYGLAPFTRRDYLIKDTTFERVGVPLAAGMQKASGCAFIACGTAVMDRANNNGRGTDDIELTDCLFRGNEQNWSLTYSDNGLALIDCTWDKPIKEDVYRVRTNKKRPKLFVRRHAIVEVLDAAGRPVKDATVSFKAEQGGCDLPQNRTFKTNADGKTPEKGQANAMLLTEYIKTATDTPDQPEVKKFTYIINAEKGGKRAMVANVGAERSWKIVTIKLTN